MKVTIDFEDDIIAPAIQEHLETGTTVQNYIQAAMLFFNTCKEHVKKGEALAHGNPDQIRRYHTVLELPRY